MGRAMKFFIIKMKNKMSIVKVNHSKKGNKKGKKIRRVSIPVHVYDVISQGCQK